MHVYKKPSGLWAYKIDIGKNPRTGKRQQKEKDHDETHNFRTIIARFSHDENRAHPLHCKGS